MVTKSGGKQGKLVITTLESLMPEEHFLRDLNNLVNFDFIYEKVEHLYSSTGRPSIDPVVLVKMLLLGYLYGIDSERKIEREVKVNIAYRWFLGIDLDEPVPDHSTLSQIRRHKFSGRKLWNEIFDEVVRKCIEAGLVDGKLLLVDSTHVRANADNTKRETITVINEPSEYMQRLDRLALEAGLIGSTEKKHGILKTKQVTKSIIDPESGILARPGKPTGFHYLSHQTCDGKSGIITDVYVTPGNVQDNEVFVERITTQIDKFRFDIKEVGADGGYDVNKIHKDMLDLGIKTYIPIVNQEQPRSAVFPPSRFVFNEENNVYICPNNCILTYRTYRKGQGRLKYCGDSKDCMNCPLKSQCISPAMTHREIERPYHKTEADKQRENTKAVRFGEVKYLRKIRCEGNFAIQKDNHNLRRTRKRGLANAYEHCLLSALALNLKRLVKGLKEKPLLCFTNIAFTPLLLRRQLFCSNS